MKLTFQQKLDALAYRFYQGAEWAPKEGDYYTTSRADLELYQVVSVADDVVRTLFTEGSDAITEWSAGEFLTGGFGPKRVFVPNWVLAPRPESDVAPTGVDIPRLPRGTPVEKVGGYPFPGTVVVAFHTLSGQERFVVEATGPAYAGMLHIFNGGQLRAATAAEGSADA